MRNLFKVQPEFSIQSTTKTRMHSSRMRTVRCSSRLLGGGVSAWLVSAQGGVCLGGVCLGGVCPGGLPGGMCIPVCTEANNPPVDRILDTRFWKHYLAATLLRTVPISSKTTFILGPIRSEFSSCRLLKRFYKFSWHLRWLLSLTWNQLCSLDIIPCEPNAWTDLSVFQRKSLSI